MKKPSIRSLIKDEDIKKLQPKSDFVPRDFPGWFVEFLHAKITEMFDKQVMTKEQRIMYMEIILKYMKNVEFADG